MKKIFAFLITTFLGVYTSVFADEIKLGHGKFDEGKGASETKITEITYVYDNRDLPLNLTPLAGGLQHGQSAYMIYAGVQKKFKFKRFGIIPSFAPGYYNNGDEIDLGYDLQFKTQVELTLDLINGYTFSYAWNHISNANLGDTNPGVDNEMFFITKQF